MFKKITALIVILTMLATFMTSGFASGISPYPKNGFRLVAQDTDSTGIAVDTEFILETEKNYSLEEIQNAFSIDGEPSPKIEEMDTNLFSINLSRPLMENSLYTFRMSMDTETTWVFQTQSSFKIVSSLPAEKSVSVPVNSGIEITFSHENFSNIESYFEITPAVKGKFEVHKKTAVFVPESLNYDTVYTVTIHKGMYIQGTKRTIGEDYVFSFETQSKAANSTPAPGQVITNLNPGRYLYDFGSLENPDVVINYSSYMIGGGTFTPPTITTKNSIYAYNDFNSFVSAIEEKNVTPYWAQSYNKKFAPVDKLQKVLEFEQVLNEDSTERYGNGHLKVPQTLPEGYYVLDGYYKDIRFQTFLQITNTGIYISESNSKTLVWLNDLSTQNPIEGASISFIGCDKINYSGVDGIAYFDSINTPVNNSNKYYSYYIYNRYNQYMIVTTKQGKSSLLDCSNYSYINENNYWSYFYTDRGMYKSNDTINVWGYIKNRYEDEKIDYLSLEINRSYYSNTPPIVKQNIDVNKSFYEGAVKLPDLPEGYYYITLKKGDKTIINRYITVENYTKPSYKLEISKDKNAIFVDDEANFNIKASFFEGTGVSNLSTSYSIYSYNLLGNTNKTQTADLKGNLGVKYAPSVGSSVQDECTAYLEARATLPESGEIRASSYLRVFVNDIKIQPSGKIKDGVGTISAQVNKIDLDRINSGTAKNSYDYLSDAVSGKTIKGTIYKNTWNKIENGTYYDYINKITYKTYRYELLKEPVSNFSMVTSNDGYASYTFNVPNIPDTYYTAQLDSVDSNGRSMTYTVYCGEQLDYSRYQYRGYTLEGTKSSYGLGESVDLTFKYGNEPLPAGKYIYYKSQNGTYDYAAGSSSSYSFNFSEREVPNTQVTGVYFNGKTYVSASYSAVYNVKEKNLTIEAKTDKDSYKPGDQVTINLDVKDINGKPVKSTINLSVVDEAFFNLLDQDVDLLHNLYANVNSGVYYQGKSHDLYYSYNSYYDYVGIRLENAPADSNSGKSSSETKVREDFKDTAQFASVETDETGRGQITFKLPDNITSWRVTLSAISEDLHAGSDKVNMIVTLPFFINYSFNTSYLEGDKPILGVNAYGNGLEENDEVTFEVTGSDQSSPKLTVTGKAFERVNIPLWALNEGKQDITIKAYTDKYSDAVKHTFNVVKSYYQIEKAEYYDAAPNMTIAGGKSGFTKVVFQDKSKGVFLWDLIGLRYSYGNRIDQIISNYTASSLISKYFPDYSYSIDIQKPLLNEYQKADGGLSLLPYSESDLELTAKLTKLAKSMVNTQSLKDYYYNILDSSTLAEDKAKALYGLSVLNEPVLLTLENLAQIDNLNVKALMYIALAYCELGDISTAEQIYNNRIYPLVENFEPYYRVNTSGDKDNILEATSLCSYLAAQLQKPECEGLYEYCEKNYAKDILLNTEKLMFISTQIEKRIDAVGKVTYSLNGEEKTVTFENGSSYCLSLLPSQLAGLKITNVEGAVSAVSIFKEDILETGNVDEDISVTRTYMFTNGTPLSSNTLKQGDVIKVRLDWNMSDTAFDGVYEITDYLPSGLKPYNSYYNTEGQKISFYIYNSTYWKYQTYIEYYARVISPGTYTAQGPIIQGKTSRDNINCGKTEIVTIDASDPVLTPVQELPNPTSTPVKDILYGDLDGDGKISSIDFGYLRSCLLGLKSQFPMPIENADLNGDEKINSLDLALMRQYLLGYIKQFPVYKS
ncbi:dockerin type I domain-containing protein [Acetivibrio cellulolyticus]|uniref:dockerin type I domain-containing protein n=1 Tax=Acetivibrio cellulolyticus TaxID=35830 RepID=UPI0001E2EC2B|nr:dockerin type I domain-containing protein [Acetivibrio cellulolyticus]